MRDVNSSYVLSSSEAQDVFRSLREKYVVWAPFRKQHASRFSNQDLTVYGDVDRLENMVLTEQTFFSPKEVLFPVRETMFKVGGEALSESSVAQKPFLVFLRACDVHALAVMDAHFLAGPRPDIYYQRRRSALKIVLLECAQPFEHCYCLSMGTASTDDYDAFMRLDGDRYEWIVRDKELAQFFPDRKDKVGRPRPVPSNSRTVKISDKIENEIFAHEMWKEYSRRCIACGRCNTSCPTCTCFSVWDVKTEEGPERQRIWSACHVKKFSLLAGNHDFRAKNGERMRYKVLHKIQDFRKKTGLQMCVGCGRCDLVCPEYISMFRSIDKINAVIKEKELHGA